jgi:HEAT repeat protein
VKSNSDKSLDALWRRIEAKEANEQERIDAAMESGRSRDSKRVPLLLGLLHDDEGQVRYYALQALVLDLQEVGEAMAEKCWQLLTADEDDDVRSMAATCLGKIHFATDRLEVARRLQIELKSPDQSDYVKGAIYATLFQVAGRPPSEWSGLVGPPRAFEEHDIDWSKVAQLEDDVRRRERGSLL